MPRRTLLLLATLLTLLPLGAATGEGWRVAPAGPVEPSSAHDGETWMWRTPNHDPSAARLYFSGNHVGETILPVEGGRVEAHLGYWRDCNKDGQIQVEPYRAELLLDRALCPVVAPSAGAAHNDGAWVREFLTLAPDGDVPNAGVVVWANRWGASATCPHDVLTYDAALRRYVGERTWLGEGAVFYAYTPGVAPDHLPGGGATGADACGASYHLRDVDSPSR